MELSGISFIGTSFIGTSFIGAGRGHAGEATFRSVDPRTGEPIAVDFHAASTNELDEAVGLAERAFDSFAASTGSARARLLRAIADRLEAAVESLVEIVPRETALPEPRVRGETGRTCFQLRLFADIAEEGSWVDARLDRPDPDRKPIPKPDVRSCLRPIGPVAIFGASNFPLAFSVAGGDTASALAGGNPVVAKAHPAHPATSELVAGCIQRAIADEGFDAGLFSMLFEAGHELGCQLVAHPKIRAVGFTGSRRAGLALQEIAQARPEPIPVFAEMSSTNPIFVLPSADLSTETWAAGLHGSVNLGVGQFCTNPGLVFVPRSERARLVSQLRPLFEGQLGAVMLTGGIRRAYQSALKAHMATPGVDVIVGPRDVGDTEVAAALLSTDVERLRDNPSLAHEVFGPSSMLIQYDSQQDLMGFVDAMEGQLTATIVGSAEDLQNYRELLGRLERKVGRLVFNGFPTGVEVGAAMVHGGPFPATSAPRTTSVGTRAIERFCRPVCYQGFPSNALPPALQDGNPLGILRQVDGVVGRD